MLKPLPRGIFPGEVSSEWESVIKESIEMLDVVESAIDLQERSVPQDWLAPNLPLAELALFINPESLCLTTAWLANPEVC